MLSLPEETESFAANKLANDWKLLSQPEQCAHTVEMEKLEWSFQNQIYLNITRLLQRTSHLLGNVGQSLKWDKWVSLFLNKL